MRPLECATPERRAVNLYFRLPIDILVTTETEFGITETFPLLIPLLIRHVSATRACVGWARNSWSTSGGPLARWKDSQQSAQDTGAVCRSP